MAEFLTFDLINIKKKICKNKTKIFLQTPQLL